MNKDRQFRIKNVEFRISEIAPMRAWEIAEDIRTALGRPEVISSDIESDKVLHAALATLGAIRKEDVRMLRDCLFEYVQFKTPEQPKFLQLQDCEDMAFGDLDFTAVYEVLGRALIVNFSGTLSQWMTRLGLKLGKVPGLSAFDPSSAGQSPSSSPNP